MPPRESSVGLGLWVTLLVMALMMLGVLTVGRWLIDWIFG